MAIKPLTLLDGTTAYAVDVEAEFGPLYTDIAPINVQPANKLGTGRFVLESALGTFGELPPVCTIIPWYNYAGATFDATKWAYCNGAVVTITGVGLKTLPDLSGRYLIGFGTDGGGNINAGSLPDPPSPVGNAGNTINIAHTHDMGNHTHGSGTLAFSLSNHKHTAGTLSLPVFHVVDSMGGTGQLNIYNGDGTETLAFGQNICGGAGNPALTYNDFGGGGTTKSRPYIAYTDINNTLGEVSGPTINSTGSGTGSTGTPSTNTTSSALSATQDIRPRSIQVRFLMRIA